MQYYLLIAAFALLASTCEAGTNVYVGQRDATQSLSMNEINHSGWDHLLSKYVDDAGGVDYRAWKSSSVDRQDLTVYLNHLSNARTELAATQQAKLAFWINAYNAVTIDGILREYPTSSIRNHTAKIFGYNVWDDLQLFVGGKPYSLNQIEHEILRKMNEPRIHFAIVCASKGCPRLLREAYTADKLDNQLSTNAKHFFAQKLNFAVAGNTITLSSILDWFNADFGDTDEKLLGRIYQWLPVSQQQSIRGKAFTIRYAEYDWSINEQSASN